MENFHDTLNKQFEKSKYPIGHWFTCGYIPHEILEYTNDNKYKVAFGYPRALTDNFKIMTHAEVTLYADWCVKTNVLTWRRKI